MQEGSAPEQGSGRAAGGWAQARLAGPPAPAASHGLAAAWTQRLGFGCWERFGRFEVGGGRLPGGALGGGEHGGLLEEGADPVEFGPGRGMEPAEAADAMKAGGQDVLEEAADRSRGGGSTGAVPRG